MSEMRKPLRRRLAHQLLAAAFADRQAGDRPGVETVAEALRLRLELGVPDAELAFLEAVAADPGRVVGNRRRRLLEIVARPVTHRLASGPGRARPPQRVLAAAARVEIERDQARTEDTTTLDTWVREKGTPAMTASTGQPASASSTTTTGYAFESRGLPAGFDRARFEREVRQRLQAFGGQVSEPFRAVVTGRLLLNGNTDTTGGDFGYAVKRAYDEGVRTTRVRHGSGKEVYNKDLYDLVDGDIRFKRPREAVRYQELASVADHVVGAADRWDVTDVDQRRSQVDVGILRYADDTADTGFASLELPPIVSDDASNQEIERTNVEAVAMIAAAAEIEQTGAFDVVDRMLELFLQGMLPVRDDPGGQALDRYYWQADERLDASARAAQFARVIGQGDHAGADVSPNTQFEQLLMRFVSSVVRYDGDLQVSNVIRLNQAERPATSEPVRKAAQDLAANASLYGWGFSIFAARRLSRHVELVFDVLGQETLQRAYGATGPWQLVERVSSVEFGTAPAIVAHRTRAQSIKDLLDKLAFYSLQLGQSGAVRPFLPGPKDIQQPNYSKATVSVDDYNKIVTAANNMLAVGGVTEDEIARYAQPVASAPRGTIPTVGGDGHGDQQAGLDQIRQLVSQGQTPSIEQLQRLLPSGNGLV